MLIAQFNATSIRNKSHALSQYLYNNNIAVACICETFLKPNEPFSIKNYTVVRSDRASDTRGGGVLIAIRKDLNYKKLCTSSSLAPIEACICEINFNNFIFNIVTVYIPPNAGFSSTTFGTLFNHFSNQNVLVCGDFNAHNTNWGSSRTDSRGRQLLNFFENKNFVLLNDGSMTFFSNAQSALDLTFASPSLSLLTSWTATNELLGSLHCVVTTSLNITQNASLKTNHIIPRHINKAFLNKKIKEIFESSSFSIDEFTQAFRDSFQVPAKKRNIAPNPWWNETCNDACVAQKLAFSTFKRSPSRDNLIKLQIAQKTYKYTLKCEKAKGWKSFCSSLDANMSVSEFWSIIKRFKGNQHNSESGLKECIQNFCDSLAGPCGPIMPPSLVPICQNHFLTAPFTFGEINKAITQSKNSAPGLDGICNSHLKELSVVNKHNLLNSLNRVLSTGNIPDSWLHYKVIPLRKKACDPNLASSYRSIALASCLRKIFERILNSRLEWFLESRSALSKSQFGFRRAKSTKDNILSLWCAILLSFAKKEFLFASFLDIKGAFDWANIIYLIQKLEATGAPDYFCYLIHSLFYLKILHIFSGDSHETRHSFTGVPQGSVLSPLLFNIYINDIFKHIPNDVYVLAYADDIVVFCSNKNPYIARLKVQVVISTLEQRLADLQLSLSANKSKSILFSKKPTLFPLPREIMLNSGPIEYVESFCFLGTVFHKNLSMAPHLDHIAKTSFQFANIMRSLCGISWGSDPSCLLRIYTSVIRPKIEYAAPLLLDCTKTQKLKLNRLQWKCLRISLGAFPSTHTLALEQLAQTMPLPQRFSAISGRIINQLFSNPNHIIHTFLEEFIQLPGNNPTFVNTYQEKKRSLQIATFTMHPMFLYPYESLHYIPPIIFLNVNKSSCTRSEVLNLFETFNRGHWSQFQKIYTDGSKTQANVGFGVWIPDSALEVHFDINPSSSIFSAEASAIAEALQNIDLHIHKKFLIITDSRSVLEALNTYSNNRSHPLVHQIRSLSWKLRKKDYEVRFLWVPSHMGIDGNEIVDSIASNFARDLATSNYPIFVNDLKCMDKSQQIQIWQERWDSSENGRYLYSILPRINLVPWFHNTYLSRHVIVTINRLLCNHNNCAEHLFKLNLVESNLCSCGMPQTTNHLIFECSNVDIAARHKLFSSIRSSGHLPINIIQVLKTFDTRIFNALHTFFKKCDIKI